MGGVVSRWKPSKSEPPSNEEGKEDEAVLTRALGFAWVTLATNDSYSLGALVLAHSLRNANTAHKLAVLITPAVSPPMKEQLSTVFDVVKVVDVLDSKDEAHLALMKRPELGVTFTKIHCWRLTEFEKCVFLDADTLVLKNCDELFDREELSAAPDVGWPDCFNTGVFVFKPSIETFDNLVKFSLQTGSFDGGDQGLLNQFFGDWATKDINKHLPFVYNLTSVAVYSYIPAFKQYGSEVRIVHFIGAEKPWLQQLDPQTRSVHTGPSSEHLAPMLQMWWNIFCEKVHPSMTTNLECDTGMTNEIEACVNDNPFEPEPENPQPFTPYIDTNDSRQINLPYQHFDVVGSTGELLNITYLEMMEKTRRGEEDEEKETKEENVIREEAEEGEGYREPEKAPEENNVEVKDIQHLEERQSLREEPPEEQTPEVQPSPFNHDTFFPDETCVQNYLEYNLVTYQPLDNHDSKQDVMDVPEPKHHLPRFLTIAEDDRRQSLNMNFWEDPKPSHTEVIPPPENQNQTISNVEAVECWYVSETSPEPEKPTKKSMSHPGSPPTAKPLEEVSFWKSHPNLSDPNKRYSMPKLKPILPRQPTPYVFVSDAQPKITQYTEFHLSCEYPDAAPFDTLGFIERHILEEVTQKLPNADTEKLRTQIFPLEAMSKTIVASKPTGVDDVWEETDYDLSSCERQKGNQPLQNATKKRSNSCFLPILKPIRPSNNEETKRTVSRRKKKERGTKAKIESRKAREKAKAETNIKPSGEPSSVEDILKKLIGYSKDYQKCITERAMDRGKENILSSALKVYSTSTKESPRIQYSKEFEEPLSPLVNGHPIATQEATATKQAHTVNGYVEEPTQKITSTKLNTEPEEIKEVTSTEEKSRKDDAETAKGNERLPNASNGESFRPETPEPIMPTVEIPGTQRNGTRSPEDQEIPMTYASVVKRGYETTYRTGSVEEEKVRPKKKISKPSRAGTKVKKDRPRRTERVPHSPPPPPPSPPEETESEEESANLFTLLPEDSPGNVALTSPKRKPKPIRPRSTRRTSSRKTNQDRRVVESLQTVDDGLVNNSGIAGAIAKLSIQPGGLPGTQSEASSSSSSAQEDHVRRQNWEMGTMDYMGRDSFDNIWSKICETIDGKVTKEPITDGASTTPSAEAPTPQKDDVAPEKIEGQTQVSAETMTARSEGDGTISTEITAKATEIASKATEALEAFGKLFVSGPVAIKSEVPQEGQKPPEEATPAEEAVPDEAVPTERKKSTEIGEDGKQKKGVINKILELVGVGTPETSTAVFYDTEQPQGDQPKEDLGKSVFYDAEQPKLGVAAAEGGPKVRAPSPSLILKTSPGTEVVCPTPPSTPMTPQVGLKDEKMLTVDDTIKATPPVTEKRFDDVAKPTEKDTIKSEVDNIIDAAKKLAEDQLQEPKKEGEHPPPSTSMALVPRLNDALEVFGKLFVSGPVTIKSEVPEEGQKTAEDVIKPAIPMPEVPTKTVEPPSPVTPETSIAGVQLTEPAKQEPVLPQSPATPQPTEPAKPEPVAPQASETSQASEPPAAEAPKAQESSTQQIAELATSAVEAVAAVLAKAMEPAEKLLADAGASITPVTVAQPPTEPATPATPQVPETQAAAAQLVTPQPKDASATVTPPTAGSPAQVAEQPTEPATPATPQVPETQGPAAQQVTPQSKDAGTPVTPQIAETPCQVAQQPTGPAIAQTAESPAAVAQPPADPGTPTMPQAAETQGPAAQQVAPQSKDTGAPVTPQIAETPSPVAQQPTEPAAPATAQATEPTAPAAPQVTEPPTLPQMAPSAPAPSAATAEVPPKPSEPSATQPDQSKKSPEEPKTEPDQSPSILSKASEALEAFGKSFVSGPVTLKSEVPEPAAPEKPESEKAMVPKPADGHSKTTEALEAFGKSFVSGPVTLKSEIPEEVKTPGEAETDAVHRVFQSKPEGEPIYTNIEQIEEIKVTSEEDRRKEKPQSSKLTEQILKAIPPELRKPFSEATPEVPPEVAQLLSAAGEETANILLDKPAEEEATVAEGGEGSGPSVPPVPPRRNRSKGRDAPLPPPKKKGKNGKD